MDNKVKHTRWFHPTLDDYTPGEYSGREEVIVPVEPPIDGITGAAANVISSRLYDPTDPNPLGTLHSPVLDLDYEAELVPSSTPGHYHLRLPGLVLEWDVYAELLAALAKAGVVEEGFAQASLRRRMSLVRTPRTRKRTRVVSRSGNSGK